MATSHRLGIFTGRMLSPDAAATAHPLIIAIHGGTYSSLYFDIADHSLLKRAQQSGVPAIAIDRYGYGGTPFIDDMTILGQAAELRHALVAVWEEYRGTASGIVLVGHSIGAAIALGVAGAPGLLPLLGVAVSGIGMRTPATHTAMWAALPDLPTVDMPASIKDQLMFGPAGSYAAKMPAASHIADAPVPKAELVDIVGSWQQEAAAVCAAIQVPVHYRQAEHDHLWIVDPGEIDSFAQRFTAAPRMDAAMVPGAGHCIDFHIAGAKLHLEQLAFARGCAVGGEGNNGALQ